MSLVQENQSNSVLIECMINVLNASAYNIIIVTNYRFCVYSESEQYFVEVEYTKPTACVNTCTTSCKFCSVTYCIIKHILYTVKYFQRSYYKTEQIQNTLLMTVLIRNSTSTCFYFLLSLGEIKMGRNRL